MHTKPRLVDPAWFDKPKPKLKVMKKSELSIKSSDNSLMINLVGFLILCIGGLCIYQRYIEREKTELETQNTIIGFHEYVKENIK
jgi:hypothetical protein